MPTTYYLNLRIIVVDVKDENIDLMSQTLDGAVNEFAHSLENSHPQISARNRVHLTAVTITNDRKDSRRR